MVAVVTHTPGTTGKHYRIATDADRTAFQEVEDCLAQKRKQLVLEWGIDAVPDEPLRRVPLKFGVINVWVYGMNTWGDLYNSRQKLALITFAEKVRNAYQEMVSEGVNREYAKAVVSYLALILSRTTDFQTTLCNWHPQWEFIPNTFARPALPMKWDYAELNPFAEILTGTWQSMTRQIIRPLEHLSQIHGHMENSNGHAYVNVSQTSAANLSHPDSFFDAVFTDPPYYDNVPYSYLADFFYVWLKRTLGDLYPELFSTPLTPKRNEIVAYTDVPAEFADGSHFFETMLRKSFQEINRVLKPNGIAVIVYAHKSTKGWETLINSLLDSGLIMTGAWPLSTEMTTRLRAQESATLASSIYIVARKMERQPTGFYNEVQQEMQVQLNTKLHRLWEEGLGGADFFIAAIGSAIEVFGKYEKVMDYEGKIVRADRLLDDVREIATDYAVRQILRNGFAGEISDLSRFYVLWRWEFGEARVDFDEARKLAQCCGIDLSREWGGKGFVVKEKQFIRVVGPQSRDMNDLQNATELINALHHVLLLWEKNDRDEMMRLLAESGYGESEAFFRVAQAISETLPIESREKKLLDGFLAGKARVREEMRQGRLF